MEEFKLQEDDDDQIDLLGEGQGLQDLKNALIKAEFQGFDADGDFDLGKIKHNTVIGMDEDEMLEKQRKLDQIKLMSGLNNLPGQTPMNT